MKKSYFRKLSIFVGLATLAIVLIGSKLAAQVNSTNFPIVCSEQSSLRDRHCSPSAQNQTIANEAIKEGKPKIQIAILLDSSNSMDGLIEQARTQIWDIVNALTKVTKNGETPILEVALFHYGNDSLPSSEGFNRLLNGLTTDLDIISEKLFIIKTNGGQEYAGWVINSSLQQLNWSKNEDDFRVIFIAGNEPFDQGEVNWQKSVKSTRDNDIILNTIYCENAEKEDSRLWAEAAQKGKGNYFNINQNQKIITIDTPYDQELVDLNNQLNKTYLPYGAQGTAGQSRQQAQDANLAEVNPQAVISRGITKTSGYYRNSSWDLVDAITEKNVDLQSLANSELPKEMKNLSLEEKETYLKEIGNQRKLIQSQITQLSVKRNEYIETHSPKTNSQNSLNVVMIEALRQQLKSKGFTLQ